MLSEESIIATTPEAIEEVMNIKSYDFQKPAHQRKLQAFFLGDGVASADEDDHRYLRKAIAPAFSHQRVRNMYSGFWRKSVQLTKGVDQAVTQSRSESTAQLLDVKIDDAPETAVIEMVHWANKVTLDLIGIATIGRDFQTLQDENDPIVANYEELLHPTTGKVVYLAASLMFGLNFVRRLPWQLPAKIDAVVSRLRSTCLDLVKEKRGSIDSGVEKGEDGSVASLLITSNDFSDGDIATHVQTCLPAGHETTASSFGWALYLLATHPDIQAALRDEIRKHVPSMVPNYHSPTDAELASILESLPLLNGVMNEAFRLFPALPVGVRATVRPTTLMGHQVPVGITAIICPWAVQRNPKVWGDNCDEFVPERWIDTDEKTGIRTPNKLGGASSTYAMLLFFYGPRTCPGQEFARAEMRCLLAAFVGKFEMALADPRKPILPHTITATRPKHGLHLRLTTLSDW
ncbi:hypothetical protein PFICI_00150 [Pestalotiopsis fici W106-1]|uniref:Cytochrome P450 n=1 Tax=Pestalotiopsis fici (strain W106-1 / CGMCC3.15140) TaxID=1229662 RepID=W3XLJ0_PESFW|nr:uncharacterized protein PFICI_00150 [Pestalotiopsis fici W106-1]ETS86322.1 hypothetical protein PFICI_00150 [Pestalotiopsis fici W106-1]